MPSFWKILCFPNHRPGNKNNTTSKRSRERDKFRGRPRSELTRGLQPEVVNDIHDQFPAPEVEDDTFRDVNRDSQKGLIDDNKTKKRRRVQDIFNPDFKKDESLSTSVIGHNGGRTYGAFDYSRHQHVRRAPSHREFGSGYTPHGCRQNANNQVESMYRYVPKAVQNVYASKALEGKQMDDFFNRLHRESSMTHFAAKPLQLANEIVMQSPPKSTSGHNDDKASLIPQTEIESGSDILNDVMDADDDYNGNVLLNMAPRSRALNTNFEQIWNSTGEVLY
ncbi:uncharacterized protein LOC117337931 isoform X2 [Pecten maximus]|uniref:uncharacterized protein LOC117337931 isoform X2 n=1 Tax=Pecten maximus TaxID=6579 RepID=UPI001457F5B1|nr:uncharacterized protein LOC117337931 isoform X2 [Pecten maximus]